LEEKEEEEEEEEIPWGVGGCPRMEEEKDMVDGIPTRFLRTLLIVAFL